MYRNKTSSLFDLLGKNENAVSGAIATGFSKAPVFLELFLKHINIVIKVRPGNTVIKLQEFEPKKGFTDFEIEQGDDYSIIVEAKKGWNYPSQTQLDKYSSRPNFNLKIAKEKKLVVFTESTPIYTASNFGITHSNTYEVVVVSYRELWHLIQKAILTSNNFGKQILRELSNYLQTVMTMQNVHSNKVFVVSLGGNAPDGWSINWQDVVRNKQRYFHPVGGNGWPAEPPNYIGFRFGGRLQSIHHVESYEVFTDPHLHFQEIPSGKWTPHYIYQLGEPIIPQKTVLTGKIFRNGRVWAMLDLLLTCNSISEARDKTQARERQQ